MSKMVTIPNNEQPMWECTINGVDYAYPAGAMMEVPDEVASLIEGAEAVKPKLPKPTGGGMGGADWNAAEGDPGHVLNRTHWEETTTVVGDTLTWDGNSEGLVGSTSRDGITYYKISDNVFTDEQMKTMTLHVSIDESFVFAEDWETMQGMYIIATEDCTISYMVASVRKDGAVCNGITFPEKGFYYGSVSGGVYFADKVTSTEPIFKTVTTTLKPLDEKYLPILTSPGGKKFKLSVDDSGTLTATEV